MKIGDIVSFEGLTFNSELFGTVQIPPMSKTIIVGRYKEEFVIVHPDGVSINECPDQDNLVLRRSLLDNLKLEDYEIINYEDNRLRIYIVDTKSLSLYER